MQCATTSMASDASQCRVTLWPSAAVHSSHTKACMPVRQLTESRIGALELDDVEELSHHRTFDN